MSLRRRLTLSLLAILILFALNVGTHFWGSYARSQSMVAYRTSVTAAQLSTEVEQMLEDQRQQVLVLSTLRETTQDQLGAGELSQAEEEISNLRHKVRQLGELSPDVTYLYYRELWEACDKLLSHWLLFYRNYNDASYQVDMADPAPYLATSSRLEALETRQTFVATQRAAIIDRTIALTDRITLLGFVSSIVVTALLGLILVRYTNRSLKRLKTGTQRIGSGDLNYRIAHIEDKGELGDLALAFNDMSDKLRNAIYDVRKAKDAADDANAAKSLFLANVSHELRTPLNAIIGYSEMLHDELGDGGDIDIPQYQNDLDKIIGSGRQLLSLINDILDLSKIETGKMSLHCETFEAESVIRQICDNLSPLLQERGNQFNRDDLSALPTMYNDVSKFRQIFINLLSNASKFTENGYISVGGRALPSRPGWLEFTVRDTGIGMTRQQQERVFEAFVQAETSTSANYGGTGLGLAICREHCALMGGSIEVSSEAGVGSTFRVLLPVDPELTRADA